MRVMLMAQPKKPFEYTDMPIPEPGPLEVFVKVSACSISRTDLHVIDDELRHPVTPLILGIKL